MHEPGQSAYTISRFAIFWPIVFSIFCTCRAGDAPVWAVGLAAWVVMAAAAGESDLRHLCRTPYRVNMAARTAFSCNRSTCKLSHMLTSRSAPSRLRGQCPFCCQPCFIVRSVMCRGGRGGGRYGDRDRGSGFIPDSGAANCKCIVIWSLFF